MTQAAKNWTIGIIVVVVIVGGIWWYAAAHSSSNTTTPASTTTTTQPAQTTTATTGTEDTSPATGIVSGTISYDTAVREYANDRIQFSVGSDNSCLVAPAASVFKNGTDVMLDNRIGQPVTFSIGTLTYTIKAYGFRIVTLSTTYTLPHAMTVNCDNGKNNGTVTLEK